MTFTDANGREWRVHDYAIYGGKSVRYEIGKGQYRGFEPLDRGARRTFLMLQADRDRGTSVEVLREQLAASKIYHRDDPVTCGRQGREPERRDSARA